MSEDFADYDGYAALTKSRDWKGICKLNGMVIDAFGTKKELNVLDLSTLQVGPNTFRHCDGSFEAG